jgi:hydrogenase maturation protease
VDSYLLVIGYGNTLRRDDGVGPRVASKVEALRLPGVLTMACPQLTPELADPLAHAESVVFVDACIDRRGPVRLQRLDPSGSSQILAHAADPRVLLALARDAFGHAPRAWMLTIPARELGFGETLSRTASLGLRNAVRAVRALHCRLGRRRPARPGVA